MRVSGQADQVMVRGVPRHVVGYLKDFLFDERQVRAPVRSLSGGEKARLLLARIMARESNLLILDEPTNDLDVETLDLLQDILGDYDGTVLLVSHDRAFLENTVTQVIAFEGQGQLSEFGGGYDDWLRYSQQRTQAVSAKATAKAATAPVAATQPAAVTRKKLSFKEQKELDNLPAEIEALEQEQAEIQRQFSQGEIYRQAPEQVKQLQSRLDEIETLVLEKMERWEQLESLLG